MELMSTGCEVEEDVTHMLFVEHGFGNLDGGFGDCGVVG